MKSILISLFLLVLLGCVSKKKAVQRSKEQKSINVERVIDSLVSERINHTSQEMFHQQERNQVFQLKSIRDTKGVALPVMYSRKIQGVEVERIEVQGAELVIEDKQQKKQENKRNKVHQISEYRSKVKQLVKRDTVVIVQKIEKEKVSTNVTFGIYALAGVFGVVLIIIIWLNQKLQSMKKML